MTFADLADLVAAFAPYNEESRGEFFLQLISRAEIQFSEPSVARTVQVLHHRVPRCNAQGPSSERQRCKRDPGHRGLCSDSLL